MNDCHSSTPVAGSSPPRSPPGFHLKEQNATRLTTKIWVKNMKKYITNKSRKETGANTPSRLKL